MTRVALACTLAVAALAALAATAGAIIPGPNGPIVFTSGRGGAPGDDSNAKIYVANGPGAAIQVTTGATRHSHPAWSPDRTKIAYSKSVSGAGARDIWIKDLITGADLQVTDTTTADEDRAAWSPDGTKLAYGVRAAADPTGATEQADIMIDSNLAAAGGVTPFANVADDSEDRPAWSPDGQFIYYARDENTPYNDNNDIVRKPADGGSVQSIVAEVANEWQPALSPDGTKVCYSRGGMSDTGANGVDVYLANTNGLNSNITMFKTSSTKGEFNCMWSPDGTRIGYTFGVFSGGDLLTAPSDGSLGTSTIADSANHFDGNADWTYNPLPTCADGAASVAFNSFVSITLSCTDAVEPTDTEPQDVDEEIVTPPPNGNLGALQGATVIYTPKANFQGQDSFTFKGTNFGFGGEQATSNVATVSITVAGPGGGGGGGGGGPTATCAGRTATKVGTSGADVIVGTRRRDVIAALGGNDRVRGGGGGDLICAGGGRDRVAGGRGGDRVLGGSGPDRLSGNSGKDRLSGGRGRDTLIGGSGRDRLNGGPSRDVCRGGLGLDAGTRCEVRSSIP